MAHLAAAPPNAEWLSLGEACRLLQVSEPTLRHWADAGHLRVYRTPGGHRRFLRADLLSLTAQPPAAPPLTQPPAHPDPSETAALRRIRRRLNHAAVAQQPWYQSIAADSRDRMRLFGRRLLSLLLQQPPPRKASGRWHETLAEARMLGHEYGAAMAQRQIPVQDTVAAFIFFRSLVLDSVNSRAWPTLLELSDPVLLALVAAHQQPTNPETDPEIEPETEPKPELVPHTIGG